MGDGSVYFIPITCPCFPGRTPLHTCPPPSPTPPFTFLPWDVLGLWTLLPSLIWCALADTACKCECLLPALPMCVCHAFPPTLPLPTTPAVGTLLPILDMTSQAFLCPLQVLAPCLPTLYYTCPFLPQCPPGCLPHYSLCVLPR